MRFSRHFAFAVAILSGANCVTPVATASEFPAGGSASLTLSSGVSVLLSDFSGGGSTHDVAEIKIILPGGTVFRKLPGRLEWQNLIATRPVDTKRYLWDWRAQVEGSVEGNARQNVSVTLFDSLGLEIRRDVFSNAWPFAIEVLTTNGLPLERLSITHEGRVGFNVNPEVTLQSPAAQSVFWNPTNIAILASAQYPDVLDRLQFFAGPTLIGTGAVSQAGFKFNWANPPSGDFTLSAIATDETGATHGSVNFVPISVRYGMTYNEWRLSGVHFSGGEKENPAISGPLADPDQDRAPNLLEFAAGTDPKSAPSVPVVRMEQNAGECSFVYRRRRGGISSGIHDYRYADARMLVETSTDLRTWIPATDQFSEASVNVLRGTDSEDAYLRLNRTAAGFAPRYFRLRVELIP